MSLRPMWLDGTITAYSWSFPGGEPEFSNVATPGNVTYLPPEHSLPPSM
jgi:hypothetical protein